MILQKIESHKRVKKLDYDTLSRIQVIFIIIDLQN